MRACGCAASGVRRRRGGVWRGWSGWRRGQSGQHDIADADTIERQRLLPWLVILRGAFRRRISVSIVCGLIISRGIIR